MTFFCRADDIFEKSVEQSRFEQMHFEQLTLTRYFELKNNSDSGVVLCFIQNKTYATLYTLMKNLRFKKGFFLQNRT